MSGLRLIISGLYLAFLVQGVSAQPTISSPQLRSAPLNPEFIAWQRKVSTFGLKMLDRESRPMGHIPSPFDWSHLRYQKVSGLLLDGMPVRFDLRDSRHVTSVKDKGGCGCCWCFASYGSLESWLLKNKGETRNFSENHLKNYNGFDGTPCDGGNADMSTAYLTRWSGPVNESDDEYHDWDDRPSPGGPCQKYVKSVLRFTTEQEIKNGLMTYGGMHVYMYYDDAYLNLSNNTYYYSGNKTPNHGVTLVGWDDNKVVPRAPDKGAWIVKNDFGKDWGEDGYFYVSYYDANDVLEAVAFCDAVPTSTYISNYQYDPLGQTGAVGYKSTTAWGANIFIARANEYLGAVGFHSLAKNTSYEIYVYDNFNGMWFYDLLGSISGIVEYPGYHTITLTSPISLTKGDDFSIVIKFTTPGFGFPVPIEQRRENYSSGATANLGESYVSENGVFFGDITNQSDFENANICIKGLTVPGPAFVDVSLRVFDGREIISIACEPEGTLTSPLRIAKNGIIYGIVLVDPSDPHASKMIVQTSSGPKALRKY